MNKQTTIDKYDEIYLCLSNFSIQISDYSINQMNILFES